MARSLEPTPYRELPVQFSDGPIEISEHPKMAKCFTCNLIVRSSIDRVRIPLGADTAPNLQGHTISDCNTGRGQGCFLPLGRFEAIFEGRREKSWPGAGHVIKRPTAERFPEWARLDEDQKPLVAALHRMMGVERALDGAGMSGDTDMTFLGPVGPLFFDLFATLQSNHRSFFVGTENQP